MRVFGKIILWGLALLGGLGVAGLIGVIMVISNLKDEPPTVSDKSVLWLDLNQTISEKQQLGGFVNENSENMRLFDIIKALDEARDDPRIKGIVAEIGTGSMGMAKAQEIRSAIQNFRDSNKFTIAYAEDLGSMLGGTVDYYVASAFEEIWLQPSGGIGFTGFSFEQAYFKDALDELQILPEFEQRYEFKGGIDMFIEDSMPTSVKLNMQRLADSWLNQIVTGVEADNPNIKATGRWLIDNGPYLGAQALANGMVDKLAYWDELEKEIDKRVGESRQDISINEYLFALDLEFDDLFGDDNTGDATGIALIYGVGAIDPGVSGLSDDLQFSPYQVVDALIEARNEEEIKAVIFRVDSPGGAYAQSDMVWHEIGLLKAAGKPVVVTMGDYAASGGYFVSMAANHIIANSGTITGSIGVYSGKFATKALWKKLGINWDGVKAGNNAGMWGMVNSFSDSELQKFQQSVDFVYKDFTGKAAVDRNMTAKEIDSAARGRIWTGADAFEIGLIDELGGMVEAVDAARKLLNLDESDDSYLVEMPRPLSPFEQVQALLSGDGGFMIQAFFTEKLARQLGIAQAHVNALKPTVGMVQMPPIIIQ